MTKHIDGSSDLVTTNCYFQRLQQLIQVTIVCPRRGFAQEAKSPRGILVARAYIKKSTYSSNIQSVYIYQKKYRLAKNWDCKELLGNNDVSALNDRKYEMVKDDVNPKQEMLKGTSWVDFVTFIVQSVLRYSFALRVFSDILWSSCFEDIKEKLKFTFLCLIFLS